MTESRLSPRVFVHLAYGLDAETYRQQSLRGEVPDFSPYGFHHAEEYGVKVVFSRDAKENAWSRFHRRMWRKLLGFDLVHAFRNRKSLLDAELVWTMEERQYLAALMIQRIFRPHAASSVIAQTVWLFNTWPKLGNLQKWLYRSLISNAAALTVHSDQYLERASTSFVRFRPQLLHFGISLDTFPLCRQSRPLHSTIRIFAAGNDPTRDWLTLLLAFGNDHHFEIRAASHALGASHTERYSNLKLLSQPSMADFREAYRWADYVVVPMVPNRYSGITVALEAVAMGAAVVCSDTGGVPTYFSEDEVLYVPVYDAAALKAAVLRDSDEERERRVSAARCKFESRDYSSRGMARRYVDLSRLLLRERNAKGASESLTLVSPRSV